MWGQFSSRLLQSLCLYLELISCLTHNPLAFQHETHFDFHAWTKGVPVCARARPCAIQCGLESQKTSQGDSWHSWWGQDNKQCQQCVHHYSSPWPVPHAPSEPTKRSARSSRRRTFGKQIQNRKTSRFQKERFRDNTADVIWGLSS